MQAVRGFGLAPAAAAAHIAALAQLRSSHEDSAGTQQEALHCPDWGAAVLKAAEEVLAAFVEQVRLCDFTVVQRQPAQPGSGVALISLAAFFVFCCCRHT